MKTLLHFVIFFMCVPVWAQQEAVFMTADAGVTVGYASWRSFGAFRKEYNTVNQETLSRDLGSISDQVGYSAGIDCFLTKHYYTGIDFYQAFSRASARFDNDARRIMKTQVTTWTVFLGWLQPTEKGYWTLSTGINASFGYLHSYLIFADRTIYTHTGGLSGEFHDLALGMPLKFEFNRVLGERLGFRWGVQLNIYGKPFDLGMQNSFVTQTAGSVSLNDKQVNFDITGATLSAGLSYKIFRKE